VKQFAWFDLHGRYPDDWTFEDTSRIPNYPTARLDSPWRESSDEDLCPCFVAIIRHPDSSGGSIEAWFKKKIIDTRIDDKIGVSREFAGAPAYWLIPKPGRENVDHLIYAEFGGRIYQLRISGLHCENRLGPAKPLSLVLASMKLGNPG
jgi:hypothetical protein